MSRPRPPTPVPPPAALLTNVSVLEPVSRVTFWSLCVLVVHRAHPRGAPPCVDALCPCPSTVRLATPCWGWPLRADLWAGGCWAKGSVPACSADVRHPCACLGRGVLGQPLGSPCRCGQMCPAVCDARAGRAPAPSPRARLCTSQCCCSPPVRESLPGVGAGTAGSTGTGFGPGAWGGF